MAGRANAGSTSSTSGIRESRSLMTTRADEWRRWTRTRSVASARAAAAKTRRREDEMLYDYTRPVNLWVCLCSSRRAAKTTRRAPPAPAPSAA